MKLYNLQRPVKTFEGVSIPTSPTNSDPFTIGKCIANVIVADTTRKLDHFRAYELGLQFYNNDELDILEPDFNAIKEIVQKSQVYSSLILGQALKGLDDATKDIHVVKEVL